MNLEKFINVLNELAESNMQEGGSPYSAIVVWKDDIVAVAVNESHKTNDRTHHAELLAIQKATQKLTNEQMKEAIVYASGEPCMMCYAAAQYTQIQHMYYLVSRDEIVEMGKSINLPNTKKEHIPTASTKEIFLKW